MHNKGAVVSFIDAMRQVNDGREEHYVEVLEITPPETHPIETPMEVTGKFFLPPWFPDV